MAKYIVVEGADCVGKGYFIEQLVSYLNKAGEPYKPYDQLDLVEKQMLDEACDGKLNEKYQHVELAQAHKRILDTPITPTQGISVAVALIKDASIENREFTKNLHAGKLSQEEIANEYLQVIYDHHNYAKKLGMTHDLVLLDRSLPSYYAYQICGLGFSNKLNHWTQLYEKMVEEIPYHLIYLTADKEILLKRIASKRGLSAMDEVFEANFDKILAGYEDCLSKGFYPFNVRIDTSDESERPYDNFFKKLVIDINTSL